MFKFLLYKLGQFIVNHLSLKASYRFASVLSDLQYYLSFRDRRSVKNNLRIIVPDEKHIPELAKEVFRNFGKYLVEFFRMAREIDSVFMEEKIKVDHLEYVKQVLDNGKGAIILSAHIGNWELGGVILSQLGYPAMVIALPHKERPVNDLFNKQRETRGGKVIPSHSSVRKCIETLKNNGIVAVVADRDFTNSGETLDFFDRKAVIPKGAAIFSAKTGAAIIPTFLIRQADNTFRLIMEKPIYPPKIVNGQVDQETLLSIMKQHTKVIEEKIRQYPTQWLMFREFWVKDR